MQSSWQFSLAANDVRRSMSLPAACWLRLATLFSVVSLVALIGCVPKKMSPAPSGEEKQPSQNIDMDKVIVDAYQFEALFRQSGKPTTLRLELFCTDSLVVVIGKGYLGKSGIRARVSADSLLAYFPTRKQYVSDALPNLLSEVACDSNPPHLNLAALFRQLPTEESIPEPIRVIANTKNADHPRYLLFVPDCTWQMEVEYARSDTSWRVSSFTWQGIQNSTFEATRKNYRQRVAIPAERMRVVLPENATPLER